MVASVRRDGETGRAKADRAIHLATLAAHAPDCAVTEVRGRRERSWTPRSVPAEDVDTACDIAEELTGGGWEAFVGVQPRVRAGTGANGCGRWADIDELRWLAVEIDRHEARAAIPNEDAVALAAQLDARASALGLPPARLLVASGRGVWAWYAIAPGLRATRTGCALLAAAGRAFVGPLQGGDPKVFDPARIARLAGGRRWDLPGAPHTSVLAHRSGVPCIEHDALRALASGVVVAAPTPSRSFWPLKRGEEMRSSVENAHGRRHSSPLPPRLPSPHLAAGVARVLDALRRDGRSVRAGMTPGGAVHRVGGPCPCCRGLRADGTQGSLGSAWVSPWGGLGCWRPVCDASRRPIPLRVWGAWVGAAYMPERRAAGAAQARDEAREAAEGWLTAFAGAVGAWGPQIAVMLRLVLRRVGGSARTRTGAPQGAPPEVWAILANGHEAAVLAGSSERTAYRIAEGVSLDDTAAWGWSRVRAGRRGGMLAQETKAGAWGRALRLLGALLRWSVRAAGRFAALAPRSEPEEAPAGARRWVMVPAFEPTG